MDVPTLAANPFLHVISDSDFSTGFLSPSFSLPARRHILEATSDQRHEGHPVNPMVGDRPNHCVCNCSYAVSDITGSPLCSRSITLAIISPVRLHLTL